MNALVKPVVKVSDTEISVIEYKGQRVVTFSMIDQVHQRPEGTAKRNFTENKNRFVEGEDFYLIDFSKKNEFHQFGIEIPPRGLIILTESGYLMITKSLTDDLAWQVQRELINGYFRTAHKLIQQKTPSFKLGSTTRQCLMMAKACGLKGNQAILSVDRAVRTLTGESPLELLGVTHLISESKEKVFTPTQIGSMFSPKRSAQKVNGLIEAMGLQKRIDDIWVVTPEGEKFCEVLDTGKQHSNGTPVKQIKWYQSLVDQLTGEDGVE